MEGPETKTSRLLHQLLDHIVIFFFIQKVHLSPFDNVAPLWLVFCGFVALVGLAVTWKKLEVILYSCSTCVLMVYAYATTSSASITPGYSKTLCFGVVWAFVLGLSLLSRKWGLLKLKNMLCMPRYAVDLAMARIMVSALTLYVLLLGQYSHPMLLLKGYSFYTQRDVSACSIEEQTALPTGIPIPGLAVWPKLSFWSIHMEARLLTLFALVNVFGVAKFLSLPLMVLLQMRVLGQQFFYNFRPFTVLKDDDLFIEHGQVHLYHSLTLLMWLSMVLVFTPCADVLSVDAVVAAFSQKAAHDQIDCTTKKRLYGFPINFSVLLLGIGYFLSGCAKAGSGVIFGANWVSSHMMEAIITKYFIGYSKLIARGIVRREPLYIFAEFPSLRALFKAYPVVLRLSAFSAVAWECGFLFLASHGGWWRVSAFLMGIGFHSGIYMMLNIDFITFLLSYIVFVPWGGMFGYLRSLRQPIEIFHDESDTHLQMKRILASCCVLNNLKFKASTQEELEEGPCMVEARKQYIFLPSAPNQVQPSKLLEILTNWISTNRAVRPHLHQLIPFLRAVCWGLKFWDVVKARSKGLILNGVKENKIITMYLPRFAMCSVVLVSLVSVSNFRGKVTSWPYSLFPEFRAGVCPTGKVHFPDKSMTSTGSLAGYGLSLDGKQEPIEMQWLLRTEPDYKVKKRTFEEQLNGWNVDSIQLPFGCGDGWLHSFPPWYLWLISDAGSSASKIKRGRAIHGWETSLTNVIERCWEKEAWFLSDPKVYEACSQIRAADKLVYYRRILEVNIGPPWKESVWDLGEAVYSLPISNNTSTGFGGKSSQEYDS